MNKLSLWTFSYTPRYLLKHPWKFFHELYWNVRNIIHRAKYGFAYVDVWEFSHWWTLVGAEALRYMADHGHGYPGVEPFETPEKWNKHLHDMADKLEWVSKDEDDDENEYYQPFLNIFGKEWNPEMDTQESKEIKEKYFSKAIELQNLRDEKTKEIFKELGENIGRYWD